jgi:CBS domain-containing protein
MTLREVLHAHIPTLTRESTVRDAVDKMDIYQFPALVMVDGDRKPMAVLTEGDVCRSAGNRDSVTSLATEPAYIHATKDPTCAGPDLEIGDAFHLMMSSGLTLLPIVEDDRLMGVVLRTDLMQAMMMDAESTANETLS